jgi:hypothetical protein
MEVKTRWLKKFNHVLPMIPKSARARPVTQEAPPPNDPVVDPILDDRRPPDQFPLTAGLGDQISFWNSAPAETQIDLWWQR